jgi:hypothetical protein
MQSCDESVAHRATSRGSDQTIVQVYLIITALRLTRGNEELIDPRRLTTLTTVFFICSKHSRHGIKICNYNVSWTTRQK